MRRNQKGNWRWIALCAATAVLLGGCKSSFYRQRADKAAYEIIDLAEKDVFGKNREFTIDTPYSDRKPEEILALDLVNERLVPGDRFLTIQEALTLAVQNSREYQSAKEQLYLTALTLTGEQYQFRPRFLANAAANADRTSDGDALGTASSRLSATQFLKAGGNISATIANDFLRYYTGDPRKSVLSSISVNLVQPLLRGAGRSIAAESLKQAERNVIYEIRSFAQYQREFAIRVVNSYFSLLQNKDQVRNQYRSYQSQLESAAYMEAHGQAGRFDQLRVDETKNAVLNVKNAYISAATRYLNALENFKILLGLPLTTHLRLDDSDLQSLGEAAVAPLELDREKAFLIAVERHMDLLNEIDRFEDSKRKVRVAANQLKADLNILADASIDSERPTDYTSFDFDDLRVGAGIQLNLPLDRLRERNAYRSTLVNFERAIRTLSLELDQKKNEIESGLRNVAQTRQAYEIEKVLVEINERRLEGEKLTQQAGRGTVLNLNNAQDSLVRAQNNRTAAIVENLRAKMDLLLNIGVLDTDVEAFWKNPDAVQIKFEATQPDAESLPQTDEIKHPNDIFGDPHETD
jgi:outer membrane protein TolC